MPDISKTIPRAGTAMAPPGPGLPPWVPPKELARQKRETRPLPRDAGRSQIEAAAARKQWHGDLQSKPIDKAWAKVRVAIRDAEEAVALYHSADADADAHDAEYEARVAAWAMSGEKGNRPARQKMDWKAIKAERLGSARRLIEDGIAAGKTYKATVEEHAAADVDRLVEKSLKARAAAAEPITVMAEHVREAIAAEKGVRAADSGLKITSRGWWRSKALARGASLEDGALSALKALEAWLSSDDPVLTGEYIRETSPVLPMVTREWIVEHGSARQMTVLAAIEVIEERKVTDLAGDFAGVLNDAFLDEVRRGMERKDLSHVLG